ncbi:MAG: xanthine dehydrogenase [Rhodospirillaceae bacterium]|nr:xanthine dehydrogenase [Rhodospirillaceae bacterium]
MKVDTLKKILFLRERNNSFVLVRNLNLQKDLFYIPDEESNSEYLEPEIKNKCIEALDKDKSILINYKDSELFLNVFNPRLKLVIIGAVHIANSLIKIASILGYDIVLIDPRESFLNSQEFNKITKISKWPDEALKSISIDSRTAIVTLSHDPKLDEPALIESLKSKAFYIGALGSKKTHEKRVKRLTNIGLCKDSIKKINAPVGLPLGAISTEEIAISIIAQMTDHLRNKKN